MNTYKIRLQVIRTYVRDVYVEAETFDSALADVESKISNEDFDSMLDFDWNPENTDEIEIDMLNCTFGNEPSILHD